MLDDVEKFFKISEEIEQNIKESKEKYNKIEKLRTEKNKISEKIREIMFLASCTEFIYEHEGIKYIIVDREDDYLKIRKLLNAKEVKTKASISKMIKNSNEEISDEDDEDLDNIDLQSMIDNLDEDIDDDDEETKNNIKKEKALKNFDFSEYFKLKEKDKK